MSCLADLQRQFDIARCEVALVRESVRQATTRVWKAGRRDLRRRITNEQALDVSCVTWLDNDEDVCVVCARRLIGGYLSEIELNETILRNLIQEARSDVVLQAAAEEKMTCIAKRKAAFELGRMVAEARVMLWLFRMNTRGVAPGGQRMAMELKARWPVKAKSILSQKYLLRALRSRRVQKYVCRRFRRRWGVSWRRLCARSLMTSAEIRDRVL